MPKNSSPSNSRRLALDGAPNIRDLGGYPSLSGGTTRWKKLLRGGRLSQLSDNDQQLLSGLDIKIICDFRKPSECERDITKLSKQSTAVIHNLSISPGDQQASVDISSIEPEQILYWMQQINRALALNHCPTYRRMFELLLSVDDGSFLFHCSAGKDRTGLAAALILSALDVPRDVIMEDYLLTAQYYPPKGELEYLSNKYAAKKPDVNPEIFAAMTATRPEFLDAAFRAIEERYGSVENYLAKELGVGAQQREQLKLLYLEQI